MVKHLLEQIYTQLDECNDASALEEWAKETEESA